MADKKKKYGASGKGLSRIRMKKQKMEDIGSESENGLRQQTNAEPSFGHQVVITLLAFLAVFIAICFIFPKKVGLIGYGLTTGFFGLFGMAACLIPLLIAQVAWFWKKDVISGAVRYKYLVALGFLVLSAVIIHTFRGLALHEEYSFGGAFAWENLKKMFAEGRAYQGGGLLGGLLSSVMICSFGYPGTLIFGFLFLIVFGMAMFGLTPAGCVQRCAAAFRYSRPIRKEKSEEENGGIPTGCVSPVGGTDGAVAVDADASVRADSSDGISSEAEDLTPDRPNGEHGENVSDTAEVLRASAVASARSSAPVAKAAPEEILADAAPFEKGETDGVKEEAAVAFSVSAAETSEGEGEEDPEGIFIPEEYEFPSTELLQPAEEILSGDGDDRELRENADKIIETLNHFNVHVSISRVSKGPTVTRYELEPAAGTRVRSIINLLDDIALSLATSGVRSDGIIAGKSAIGIEVPNKTVNTVYIRALIEDERFVNAKSCLTTCLGMDVSGAPVYLDIARTPHLLIAGATGMGKSVCINSLLVSLLYKARPEEVKLILIDPKKVELNIYNGIPHLLVPVVFDAKKAAGALHWAVTEMERRFELIESKNTRNIDQYNAAISDDPAREFLPQIVIVIDELADLMMSAPDDVEASICRLAQKSRAAGMHLIIGTQRPSVDVITGLIKSNIPSRIAFTVASQIDSRTIIDTQGAEKLIGRGDMLYAPIGTSKPVRVQGAFVSETEIEEIVGFVRNQGYGVAYSDDVISQINKAAEICGVKKSKVGAASIAENGAEDNDPMLESAIALAMECGKISTSLIQRRLQLGYGRAAKIIDMMERRGIVSAADGQRARTVLITREQYLEMQMNRADKEEAFRAVNID